MPISDLNFGEKDNVTSCAPTNSLTPNWRSGQPMIFVFDDLRSLGTCIQLVTTISPNFFQRSWKVGKLRSYILTSILQIIFANIGPREDIFMQMWTYLMRSCHQLFHRWKCRCQLTDRCRTSQDWMRLMTWWCTDCERLWALEPH